MNKKSMYIPSHEKNAAKQDVEFFQALVPTELKKAVLRVLQKEKQQGKAWGYKRYLKDVFQEALEFYLKHNHPEEAKRLRLLPAKKPKG